MTLLRLASPLGSAVFDGPQGMTKDDFPALVQKRLLYRHWLERPLAETGPTVAFGMCNPSLATHEDTDSTITRCLGFATRDDVKARWMIVVNMFGLVSPYPEDLSVVDDPVGPENEDFIRKAIAQADIFILAFGAFSKALRVKSWPMRRLLQKEGRGFKCLGISKDGWPKHPLYLKGTTPLIDWSFPA